MISRRKALAWAASAPVILRFGRGEAEFYLPPGQPLIDWTNSYTAGLVGCWVPNGSGIVYDLTGNVPAMQTASGANGIPPVVAPIPSALYGAGGGAYFGQPAQAGVYEIGKCPILGGPGLSKQMSIGALFAATPGAVAQGAMIEISSSQLNQYSGNATRSVMDLSVSPDLLTPHWVTEGYNTGQIGLTGIQEVTPNVPHFMFGVLDAIGGNAALYVDGRHFVNATGAGAIGDFSTYDTVGIGMRVNPDMTFKADTVIGLNTLTNFSITDSTAVNTNMRIDCPGVISVGSQINNGTFPKTFSTTALATTTQSVINLRGNTSFFNGWIGMGVLYNRCLDYGAAQSLGSNPAQILAFPGDLEKLGSIGRIQTWLAENNRARLSRLS